MSVGASLVRRVQMHSTQVCTRQGALVMQVCEMICLHMPFFWLSIHRQTKSMVLGDAHKVLWESGCLLAKKTMLHM